MNRVAFDCSQFIIFNTKIKFKKLDIEKLYIAQGFEIDIDEDVESSKLPYLVEFRLDHILEIRDKEFLAEFADWNDFGQIPDKIQNFINATKNLINLLELDVFRIAFVNQIDIPTKKGEMKEKIISIDNFEGILFSELTSFRGLEFLELNMYVFSSSSCANVDFYNMSNYKEELLPIHEKIDDLFSKFIYKIRTHSSVSKKELWEIHQLLDYYIKSCFYDSYIDKKVVNHLFDLYEVVLGLVNDSEYQSNELLQLELSTLSGYIRKATE